MQRNSLPGNLRNIMQILDSVWVLKLCRSRSTNHSGCKTVLYKAMMSTCVARSAEEISDSEGCIVELLANTPFERERKAEGRGFLSLIPSHKQHPPHPPPSLWCSQHTGRGEVHDAHHKIRLFIASVINIKCKAYPLS